MTRITALAGAAAALAVAGGPLAQTTKPSKPAGPAQTYRTIPDNAQSRGVRVILPDEVPAGSDAPVRPAPTPVRPVQNTQAVTPGPVMPVVQLCRRPHAQPTLTLGSDLDRRLARELRAKKTLVVDLPQPYPERAAPPAALAPWLAEVESSGGAVTVQQYCSAARGGLGKWLAKIGRVLRGEQPTNRYIAARGYDVVLHADALDRVITQVEFRPKAPGV